MNCLAIWYKRKHSTPKEDLDVELHINLWKLEKKENKEKGSPFKNLLDIGIKILEPSNVANIYIFLPFKVTKDEIEDIGNYFEGNDKLVAAIFNDEFSAHPTSVQSKILKIIDGKNDVKFYIYMDDKKNNISRRRNNYGGTVINIKLSSGTEIKPLYYRIRISSNNLEKLYTTYTPVSQWLDSHITHNELIDFRINEKRNLDRSLLEEMRNSGEVYFKMVDYFIMKEFKYDYVSSHKDMVRSRRLEPDLWGSYVGEDYECGNTIAYHWTWDNERGFNAFVKYRFLESDKTNKLRFCIFLLAVALIGGTLGSFLIRLIGIWCS